MFSATLWPRRTNKSPTSYTLNCTKNAYILHDIFLHEAMLGCLGTLRDDRAGAPHRWERLRTPGCRAVCHGRQAGPCRRLPQMIFFVLAQDQLLRVGTAVPTVRVNPHEPPGACHTSGFRPWHLVSAHFGVLFGIWGFAAAVDPSRLILGSSHIHPGLGSMLLTSDLRGLTVEF